MLICLECGHHFEPGEEAEYMERHGLTDGEYERFKGCPVCGCAYAEAKKCKQCGGDFLEDDLFPGDICRNCLDTQITIENTMLYVLNCSMENDFYLSHWLGSSVQKAAPRLIQIVKAAWQDYRRKNPEDAASVAKSFVCDDDFGLWHYAEWLAGIRTVRVTGGGTVA